jgi:hypothetical protein
MDRQTIQEMINFLSEKGLIIEYDKSIPDSPLVRFADGQGIYFDSGREPLRYFLEGMVKAVELMERIKN